MWSHYSYLHQGVVLEISPMVDSIYSKAENVIYSNVRPAIFKTPSDMIERQCMDTEAETKEIVAKLVHEYSYSKSELWRYEEEYRIASIGVLGKGILYNDEPIHTSEITALYLGCCMTEKNQNKIINAGKRFNSDMEIWLGRRHENNYEILYDKT